jgi:hypothetical protein
MLEIIDAFRVVGQFPVTRHTAKWTARSQIPITGRWEYTSRNLFSGGCVRFWGLAQVIFLGLSGTLPVVAQQQSAPELFPVARDGKHGYIDCTGHIAIPLDYDDAKGFQGGFATVNVGGKWGFLDTAGKLLFEPQFAETAGFFSEGFAAVRVGEKWGYADRSGKLVIEPQFDSAGQFSDGIAPVERSGKYGYIGKDGQIVIPAEFDSARPFSGGLGIVKRAGRYGYINKDGQLVTPIEFEHASGFSEGLAVVQVDEKFGFLDPPRGQLVIPAQFFFVDLGGFSEGLVEVITANYELHYIDKSGKTVLNFGDDWRRNSLNPLTRFSVLGGWPRFSEGLATVPKGDLWGFIDHSGKFVIEPRYASAQYFMNGLAAVCVIKKKGRDHANIWGYVDKTGKMVIPAQFESAGWFRGCLADVEMGDKTGYVDRRGKIVWEAPKPPKPKH